MQKIDIQTMCEMELHSTISLDDNIAVFRVPDGWIYFFTLYDKYGEPESAQKTTFVPEK